MQAGTATSLARESSSLGFAIVRVEPPLDSSRFELTEIAPEELSRVLHGEESWSSVGDIDLNDEALNFCESVDGMAKERKGSKEDSSRKEYQAFEGIELTTNAC